MPLEPGGNQAAPGQSGKMLLPHSPAKEVADLLPIKLAHPVKPAFVLPRKRRWGSDSVTGLCKDLALNCSFVTDLTPRLDRQLESTASSQLRLLKHLTALKLLLVGSFLPASFSERSGLNSRFSDLAPHHSNSRLNVSVRSECAEVLLCFEN